MIVEGEGKMFGEILGMKSSLEDQNHYREIRSKARFQPYELETDVEIEFIKHTSYEEMLEKEGETKFMKELHRINYKELKVPLLLFTGKISTLRLSWKFWRHPDQIRQFFELVSREVHKVRTNKMKSTISGSNIVNSFQKLQKSWNEREVVELVNWINLALSHPYLKKSVHVLNFIQHCLPSNIWNLHIYQQAQVRQSPGLIDALKGSKTKIIQFLTVTTDGILRSKDNLLVSRIDQMLPFTNQFSFKMKISDGQMIFDAISCENESFRVNFLQDYMMGLNFYIGVRDAFEATKLSKKREGQQNRFGSFSRIRNNCYAKLYNDGVDYFRDMCNMLENARNQVLITDWWFTPYIIMKRPHSIKDKHYRVDGILKKIADRGVRVFIILFREPMNMLANDSEQAHFYLQSLSRNIRVRRHPIIPQLWSHHQKSCIIDQTYGFMGGLDICYGRWDTPDHYIYNKDDLWNGADYTNQRLRAFPPGTTNQVEHSPIDRKTEPRMPWHDIGLHVQGDAVIDMARHFIQYWNYVDHEKGHDYFAVMRGLSKRCQRAYKYDNIGNKQQGEEQFFQQEEKHDHSCGQKMKMMKRGTVAFVKGVEKRLPELLIEVRQGLSAGQMQLQLCRSASPWSIGAIEHEQSIHNAYQSLIEESEHFIYIQNQFFMGRENKIVECLQKRIRRAHLTKQNFKIVVVMPLLPGFDGDISDPKSGPLRIQVHNQFLSINRGINSLFVKLSDLPDFHIHNYIFFYGLRGHAIINGKPLTEIIYVHSKLMIVDDKRAIIGSANINDRSLLGLRDSQLAMIIEENNGDVKNKDIEKLYIFDLRRRLFEEHFSMTKQETANVNQPFIWANMITNAKNNTLIYRKLFGCYPDDIITLSKQVEQKKNQPSVSQYNQWTKHLIGHAVEFPLQFMSDENLQFNLANNKQGLLGDEAFL